MPVTCEEITRLFVSREHRWRRPDEEPEEWYNILRSPLLCFHGDWIRNEIFEESQITPEEYDSSKGEWTGEALYTHVAFEDLADELTKDRDGECLFFRRVSKMSFKTAEALERRKADRQEAKKDRRHTLIAIAVSFLTLLVLIWISGKTTKMELTKPVQIAPTSQPADAVD